MADEPPTPPKPGPPLPPQPEALLNLGFRSTVADGQPSGPEDPTALQPQPAPIDAGMEKAGDFIGSYKLIERLGVGGFGVVWRAEQHEPIHREVALKLIKPGMDSREIIARFEAERQALALMDHPNIASVLDAGATGRGRPFFVMELVKGVPITKYCDEHKLTIRERLELFIPVCQAVQHAHQKAILHRDLKPSNILVTEVDGKPVPKVIDFGVAKALGTTPEEALKASLLRTMAGMVVGTLQYMSPEQAGSVPDVDTRSDIYTLGVILYELLTGQTPLTREQLRNAAFHEVLRLVRHGEARRPRSGFIPITDLVRTAAQMRQSDARKLSHAIRGDLDWIVLKALEKDRARRYETANAFALDLRRHLEDEPVSAGPPSVAYWLGKLVRRHKVILGNAAAALLVITGLVVWFVFSVTHERDRANEQVREAALKAWGAARQAFDDPKKPDPRTGLARVAEALRYNQTLPDNMRLAFLYEDAAMRLIRLPSVEPMPVGEPMRHADLVTSAGFSPDGWRVVTASWDGTAQVWEADSGKPVGEPMRHEDAVWSGSFSPDGRRVVTASRDRTARVWEADSGKPVGEPMRHRDIVGSASFSPDGRRVVTVSRDGTLRVWEANSGKPVGETLRHQGQATSANFSPDGKWVLTASGVSGEPGKAQVWEADSGKAVGQPMRHVDGVRSASFSPDGKWVLTASLDTTARLWEAGSGKPVGEPMRHDFAVLSASFSPDGRRVLTASDTARIWDVDSGKPVGKPIRHEAYVWTASFSPDGRRVVTASADKTAQVWEIDSGKPTGFPLRHEGAVTDASFSLDGKRVVTASSYFRESEAVRVWDANTGMAEGESFRQAEKYETTIISPDGKRVARHTGNYAWQVREADSGEPVGEPMTHEAYVNSVRFSPDGRRVVTASEDKTARVWEADSGKRIGEPMHHEGEVKCASFSSDGKRVVTASYRDIGGEVRVWETGSGKPVGKPIRHESYVSSASFSPDGKQVVTTNYGYHGGEARVWEADSGKPVGEPMRHGDTVTNAGFSPDGSRVVTVSNDKTARVWEANSVTFASGAERLADVLETFGGYRVNPDGEVVPLPPDARLSSRAKLLAAPDDGSEWQKLLRWRFANPATRHLSPNSQITVTEHIEREIDWVLDHPKADKRASILNEAYNLDPGHPLIHLALAAIENDKEHAAFLREYGLKRLPADARLRAKAAEILNPQSEATRALQAANKALAAKPRDIMTLRRRAHELEVVDRPAEALTVYRAVLEAGANGVDDFTIPADLAAKTGNKADAEYFLAAGIREHPKSETMARYEGWTRINLQESAAAVAAFQRARGLLPADAKPSLAILRGLVTSQWLAGDKEAAMRAALALRDIKPEWLDPKETAKLDRPKLEIEALDAALAESLRRVPASRPKADEKR